jgi:type II secretory pathway component PulF
MGTAGAGGPRRSWGSRAGAAGLAAAGCGVWFAYVKVILTILPTFLILFHGSPEMLPRPTLVFVLTMQFIHAHWPVFLGGWAVATAAIMAAAALARSPRAVLRAALFAVASFVVETTAAGVATMCLYVPLMILFGSDQPQ